MLVVIRGAGDIATGIALRLYRAGIRLVLTDLPQPTSIRRTVCFSEAIRLGETVVEGVHARRADTAAEAAALTEQGIIAVLADPAAGCVQELHPDALVDAILTKKNLGTHITDAPIVIAVGPGFTPAWTVTRRLRPCAGIHLDGCCIRVRRCRIRAFPV